MLVQNELDMSPVSSATCANIAEEVSILPQFCLSSIGYVGSVILISKLPIEDLSGKKVGLTTASHTSAVLLKVLLEKFYDQKAIYLKADPRPSLKNMDAALVIGNDAMVRIPEPASYVYDLGDLWFRKTGFPVVFAVFAIRKRVLVKYEEEIKTVISSYHKSLRCLKEEKENVILKAKERYPDIIYDIDGYYDLLEFEFSDDLKKALMFYYSIAGEMGLLKKVERLNYL
jgi:chorismate dehydratase